MTAPTAPTGIQEFGPGVLQIGETGSLIEVSSLVNSCTLTPNTENTDGTTKLSGFIRGGSSKTTWLLTGNLDTDAGNAAGIWQAAYDADGAERAFSFTPQNDTGPTATGTIKLTPLALGATEYAADLAADFSWQCVGKPTITRPPAE